MAETPIGSLLGKEEVVLKVIIVETWWGWLLGLVVCRNEVWSLLQKNFKLPLGSCAFVQMSLQFSVQFVL